jgi:hypothetical protein
MMASLPHQRKQQEVCRRNNPGKRCIPAVAVAATGSPAADYFAAWEKIGGSPPPRTSLQLCLPEGPSLEGLDISAREHAVAPLLRNPRPGHAMTKLLAAGVAAILGPFRRAGAPPHVA